MVGDTVRSRRALRRCARTRRGARDTRPGRRRSMTSGCASPASCTTRSPTPWSRSTSAPASPRTCARAGPEAGAGGDQGRVGRGSAGPAATLDVLREQDDGAPTRPARPARAAASWSTAPAQAGLTALADVEVSDATPIASPVGQAGFRIVQESLTNVLRHADATRARVRSAPSWTSSTSRSSTTAAADARTGRPGTGCAGMAERATALGGRVRRRAGRGGGWRVRPSCR